MEDRWSAAAALVDSSRRALYDYVRRQHHPVSREEAARARRISRSLAAFHLDKLVEAGLLRARYQPPADQPRGRGRAPKVYEPVRDSLSITIPERRYQLIAEILADAVAGEPRDAATAAQRQAYRRGRDLGGKLREGSPELAAVLEQLGFEPRVAAGGEVVLRNCPFHALAARQTTLVCGLNHAFLRGLVIGLAAGVRPALDPAPDACCVKLSPAPSAGPEPGSEPPS